METTIHISADGEITMLYFDDHPLTTLAEAKKIVRASDVRFDNDEKMWFVHEFFKGKEVKHEMGYFRRGDAIASEIAVLGKRLVNAPGTIKELFEEADEDLYKEATKRI